MNKSLGNDAILVLGMHRSGTSAATRVINLLGAELGSQLLAPAQDNVQGFWEHAGIVQIHQRLLTRLGRDWLDVRALPSGWINTEAATAARAELMDLLQQEFAGVPLWVVKDPRLCRLLPLWRQVAEALDVRLHAVHIVRHPDEVADSLFARDGIQRKHSRLLWLEYVAEAQVAGRGLPRALLSYDSLLNDWSSEMAKVGTHLGVVWPVAWDHAGKEINSFINPDDRHHKVERVHNAELSGLTDHVYRSLTQAVDGTGSWAEIDATIDQYCEAAESFLPGYELLKEETARTEQELLKGQPAAIAVLEGRLAGLSGALLEVGARTLFKGQRELNTPVCDLVKLYYRKASEGYSEDRSVVFLSNELDKGASLQFELPTGMEMDYCRFDPSEFPGCIAISSMRINDVLIEDVDTRVVSANQYLLGACRGDALRVLSDDEDIHVEIDLRDLPSVIGNPARIRFDFRRERAFEDLQRELAAIVQSGLTLSRREQQGAIDALSARIDVMIEQQRQAIVEQGHRVDKLLEQNSRLIYMVQRTFINRIVALFSRRHAA
ncbi:MAG TPA: hypothetical protein VJP80_00565 [Candidatus Saccharimonadales bacterium]|nr:hypothetical protein [Candidatus Saccharimonadales bacterium]